MKDTLLFLIVLISSTAFADVYVITSPDSSVYSISEEDDAVVPAGYIKDVIKDKSIQSLSLGNNSSLYTYSGKKFTLDGEKVAMMNKKTQDAAIAIEADKLAEQSAKDKLRALGLTQNEISALRGK